MKISVSARINYQFIIDIPPEQNTEEPSEILMYCDMNDPVFHDICNTFAKKNIDFDADIVSIIDEDTDTIIYEE